MQCTRGNKVFFSIIVTGLLLGLIPFMAYAVPNTVNYQGYLTDSGGSPVNGTVDLTFTIYNAEEGGNVLWTKEYIGVEVSDGNFSVNLGEDASFDENLFTNDDLYLGIKVGTDEEMTPRRKFQTTPFAAQAKVAESLAEGSVNAAQLQAGAITSDKIVDKAVNEAKIDDGAISEAKIMNGAVTTNKLQDGAITGTKIEDATIAAGKIIDGSGSGLNADRLDGKDSTEFALKANIPDLSDGNLTLNGGIISLKELEPSDSPDKKVDYGQIYAKAAGVDFDAGSSLAEREHLELYWKMDEAEGTTVFDSAGPKDAAANGATIDNSGKIGKARRFDGIDQYIIKDNDADIDFGTGSFSISFWMKASTPYYWTVIMGKANDWGDDNDYYGWVLGNAGGFNGTTLEFAINSGETGDKNDKVVQAANVFNGVWHHVVAVRDGQTMKLYVDGGDPKATQSNVTQTVSGDEPKPLLIGMLADNYYYDGLIDEVAIWDRALTKAEVAALYNSGNAKGISYGNNGLYYKRSDGTEIALSKYWNQNGLNINFNSGNVGIGKENPEAKLDVAGEAKMYSLHVTGNVQIDGLVTGKTDNRQEVFRHKSSSFSTYNSSWTDFSGASGDANIQISKPVCWMFSIAGHYYSQSNYIHFRLKFHNKTTGTDYYFPDPGGYQKYIYTASSYTYGQEFSMTGVDSIPKGTYSVQLQVRTNHSSYQYYWISSYGQVVLILW
ncbi:putative Secreted protein containing LamG-like jellyroll fold domain protein [Candidatus Magnetomoraceae bacterium gMMP-1]